MGVSNRKSDTLRKLPQGEGDRGTDIEHWSVIPAEVPGSLESYEQGLLSASALVEDSHTRCRALGVDPSWVRLGAPLSDDDFRDMRQSLAALASYARLLFGDLHRNILTQRAVFVLTSACGQIIYLHSCPEMMERAATLCGMRAGVSLAEESCGTTAVALALRHNMAAALRTDQHFCTLFKQCCSVAYPVEAGDGTIKACAAIFGHADDHLGEKAALVRCIAKELSQFCLNSLPPDERATGGEHLEYVQRSAAPPIELTPRQLRVLSLFSEGLSYKQIARTLGVTSIKTVEEHLDAVRGKLGVTYRRQCIQRATEMGLLGRPELLSAGS